MLCGIDVQEAGRFCKHLEWFSYGMLWEAAAAGGECESASLLLHVEILIV